MRVREHPGADAYHAAIRTAGECIHGVIGGDIVRPWLDTPGCALCRRLHPVRWRRLVLAR